MKVVYASGVVLSLRHAAFHYQSALYISSLEMERGLIQPLLPFLVQSNRGFWQLWYLFYVSIHSENVFAI